MASTAMHLHYSTRPRYQRNRIAHPPRSGALLAWRMCRWPCSPHSQARISSQPIRSNRDSLVPNRAAPNRFAPSQPGRHRPRPHVCTTHPRRAMPAPRGPPRQTCSARRAPRAAPDGPNRRAQVGMKAVSSRSLVPLTCSYPSAQAARVRLSHSLLFLSFLHLSTLLVSSARTVRPSLTAAGAETPACKVSRAAASGGPP